MKNKKQTEKQAINTLKKRWAKQKKAGLWFPNAEENFETMADKLERTKKEAAKHKFELPNI